MANNCSEGTDIGQRWWWCCLIRRVICRSALRHKGWCVLFFIFISSACSSFIFRWLGGERDGGRRGGKGRNDGGRGKKFCSQILLCGATEWTGLLTLASLSLLFISRLCASQNGTTRERWADPRSVQPRVEVEERCLCVCVCFFSVYVVE